MSGDRRVTVTLDGRTLSLSNLDKLFWPSDGLTKRDLIEYYVSVAPYLLPHLLDRPLNLTRFPDGINGKNFYQKDIPATAPAWVKTVPIAHSERVVNYCLADSPATLAWLAQWGCLEIHPWLSRADALDYPDYAVFDLDPEPPAGFTEAVEIALIVRSILDEFGLRGYPKTSGATGLHIYLPLRRGLSYKETETLVGRVAEIIHGLAPGRTTRERTVARRRGVYIDHLQNIKGKTLAAVYSLRPRTGAPVSTPVAWEELNTVRPEDFNLVTVPRRLARVGDLFTATLSDRQDPTRLARAVGLPGRDDQDGASVRREPRSPGAGELAGGGRVPGQLGVDLGQGAPRNVPATAPPADLSDRLRSW